MKGQATRRRAASLLGATALTLLVVGCASVGGAEDPFERARQGEGEITILVRNRNFNDARLEAIGGGRRVRIGTVGGTESGTFRLDWNFTARLAIEIDLVPGPSCVTREMPVSPGDELELEIASTLHLTQACRRL